MEVFYIDIKKFKERHDKEFLAPYANFEFKSEKRFYEYAIGRYLIKNIAEKVYGVKNTSIIVESSGKPVFKNSNLQFCISHSNNIVMACFDKNLCGLDIEYIKQRDLSKLSNHYEENFKTLDDFYKFWTLKEAGYKLNSEIKTKFSTKFENYYLTIVSNNVIHFSDSHFEHENIIKLPCNKFSK